MSDYSETSQSSQRNVRYRLLSEPGDSLRLFQTIGSTISTPSVHESGDGRFEDPAPGSESYGRELEDSVSKLFDRYKSNLFNPSTVVSGIMMGLKFLGIVVDPAVGIAISVGSSLLNAPPLGDGTVPSSPVLSPIVPFKGEPDSTRTDGQWAGPDPVRTDPEREVA
jgi:hypothetical protein